MGPMTSRSNWRYMGAYENAYPKITLCIADNDGFPRGCVVGDCNETRPVDGTGGTCTPGEYWCMGEEKAAAMRSALATILTGGSPAAALAPFVTRARANAKRLRRKA